MSQVSHSLQKCAIWQGYSWNPMGAYTWNPCMVFMRTRLRKSVRKIMPGVASRTSESSPSLGSAKSATAKLSNCLGPYIEGCIIQSAWLTCPLNSSGRRMETQAILEPSVLYFVDSSSASFFNSLKGSSSPLLGESRRYKKICSGRRSMSIRRYV